VAAVTQTTTQIVEVVRVSMAAVLGSGVNTGEVNCTAKRRW